MSSWKDAFRPNWQNGNDFNTRFTTLTSLEGAPSRVDGSFDCYGGRLISLEGAPAYVGKDFTCSNNKLVSLEFAPSYVGGNFHCQYNQLKSLKNIHLNINHIGGGAYFLGNPIESHVLGVLLIDGVTAIGLKSRADTDLHEVEQILKKYLPSKGMESVLEAQEELITAGYEEFAQL